MGRVHRRYVAMSLLIAAGVLPTVSALGHVSAESAAASAAELDWVPLGGQYGHDPTVLSTGDVVFSVGLSMDPEAVPGGEPSYHERTGGSWSGPIPLGGYLESIVAPAQPLLEPQKSDWEIFGIGGDGAVWYRTRTSWWRSLGGVLLSDPTAVTWGGETYVFGVGLDHAVWYRSTTSDWQSLGGQLFSNLAVTTDGTSLYVLGAAANSYLWAQRLTGQTWSGWQGLGGMVSGFGFTTTYLAGTGYVFVAGVDDGVWYQGVSGGTWSGWYTLGGLVSSAPAATARAEGLEVFVDGRDGQMWSQRYDGRGWSGWRPGGGAFLSDLAVTTSHVFGIGVDDQLWAAPIG